MFSNPSRQPQSNQPGIWGIATGWVFNVFELGIFLALLAYTQISYAKALQSLEEDLTETDEENERLRERIQDLQETIEQNQETDPPSTPIQDESLSFPFLVQAPLDAIGIGSEPQQQQQQQQQQQEPTDVTEDQQPPPTETQQAQVSEDSPLSEAAEAVQVAEGTPGEEGGGNLFSFEDILTVIELVAGEISEQTEATPQQTTPAASTVSTREGQEAEDNAFEEPPQEAPDVEPAPPEEPEDPAQEQDDGEFETPPSEENVIPESEIVTLQIGDAVVETSEGETGSFTVSLSDASSETITVSYELVNGEAVTLTDAQGAPLGVQTLTFAPGQTNQSIFFEVTDPTVQGEEFTINLTEVAGAIDTENSDLEGIGLINPSAIPPQDPEISISDVAINTEESTSATFTVSLSTPTATDTTLNFATADGTATAGEDFTGIPNGTLTIPAGTTTGTITVEGISEQSQGEQFFVNLTGTSNGTITDDQGIGLINPSSIPPQDPEISISDVAINTEESTSATFTVSLSTPTATDTTLNFATADGTATAGVDFTGIPNGTLTIPAGETTGTIPVEVINEQSQAEQFFVNLSEPSNGTITDDQGIGLINPSSIPPTENPSISIFDLAIDADDEGFDGTADFTVSLSAPTETEVTVNYRTTTEDFPSDLAAEPGEDFEATQGTLTFAPGTTEETITVSEINGESLSEQFAVQLSDPSINVDTDNSDLRGIGLINPNQGPELTLVSILDTQVTEREGATAQITVTLSSSATETVRIGFETRDDSEEATAIPGEDYESRANGTVTFPEGQNTATIEIPIINNDILEVNENFFVRLTEVIEGDVKILGEDNDDELEELRRAEVTITDVADETGTPGEDNFIGGEADDFFRFASANLQAQPEDTVQDTVQGGVDQQGNPFDDEDTIQITGRAAIEDNQFSGVSNVELLRLSDEDGNEVELGQEAVDAGIRRINLEDISPESAQNISFQSISTNLTIISPSDTLNENQELTGGFGDGDTIQLLDQANLEDKDFSRIRRIEVLAFSDADNNQITFGEEAFQDGDGIQVLQGSVNSDTFRVSPNVLGDITVEGRDGEEDVLEIIEQALVDEDLANVTGIETLKLSGLDATLGIEFVQAGITRIDATTPATGSQVINASAVEVPITIESGDSTDTITGGIGDDTIEGGGGFADSLSGNEGNDTLGGGNRGDTLRGGLGDDLLEGRDGRDDLNGGPGDDTINGGDGDDTIEDNEGDNKINGGPGNDRLVFQGNSLGNNEIDGGDGEEDLLRLRLSSGNSVDDSDFFNIDNVELIELIQLDGSPRIEIGQNFSATGITTIDASGRNQNSLNLRGQNLTAGITIEGTNRTSNEPGVTVPGDEIITGSGDDTIRGNDGDDQIGSGSGDDTLSGGAGRDRLVAGPGSDQIEGGPGNDRLRGGSGSDQFRFDSGEPFRFLSDDEGNVFDDSLGIDILSDNFESGNDRIVLGDDTFAEFQPGFDGFGKVESDEDISDSNAAIIYSLESRRLFYKVGEDIAPFLSFEELDPQIEPEAGDITTVNFLENSQIGDSGDNVLEGEDDKDDILEGLGGDDELRGFGGNDTLRGGSGDDELDGGEGDDTLEDLQGDNTLIGGAGNDTFITEGRSLGNNTIEGGDGENTLRVNIGIDNDNNIEDADFLNISDIQILEVQEIAGSGRITIDENFSATGITRIDASGFTDNGLTLRGFEIESTLEEVIGTDTNDTLGTGSGNDTIRGNAGNDRIGSGGGDDTVFGGAGDDELFGNPGDDDLEGGSGNDDLTGGSGDDDLTGGSGDDRFIFNTAQPFQFDDDNGSLRDPLLGVDTLNDFVSGTDKIILGPNTFSEFNSNEDFATVPTNDDVDDSDAAIIYSQGSGGLFYKDANGDTAQFATLSTQPNIQGTDIEIQS